MTRVLDILLAKTTPTTCDIWTKFKFTGALETFSSDMNDIICAGGKYLAVGITSRSILEDYIVTSNLTAGDYNGVAYSGSVYVAVGFASGVPAGRISTSSNASSWAGIPLGTVALTDIAYGSGTWVVVGASGTVYSSTAATPSAAGDWTSRGPILANNRANFVKWNGSMFLAGGVAGRYATSPDGITWTSAGPILSGSEINDATWDGSVWTIIGASGRVQTSTNAAGTTWGAVSQPINTTNLTDIIYANGRYVAVGASGKIISAASAAGPWTEETFGQAGNTTPTIPLSLSGQINTITYCNGNFYGIGAGSNYAVTSSNGTDWYAIRGPSEVLCIASSGTVWVAGSAVSASDNRLLAFSTDGIIWKLVQNYGTIDTTTDVTCAAYGNGVFAVGTRKPEFAYSSDGINWNLSTTIPSNEVTAMWNDGTKFVAGDKDGRTYTSTDGDNWVVNTSLSGTTFGTTQINSITQGGGKWLAISASNRRYGTSTDGVTWTYGGTIGTAGTLQASTYGNGMYIVGTNVSGGNVQLSKSTDGVNWTPTSVTWGGTNGCTSIVWTGTVFVASGSNAQVYTSTDGVTWTARTNLQSTSWGSARNVNALNWAGGKLTVGGQNGHTAVAFC